MRISSIAVPSQRLERIEHDAVLERETLQNCTRERRRRIRHELPGLRQ